jgi:mercuric ion transport protein
MMERNAAGVVRELARRAGESTEAGKPPSAGAPLAGGIAAGLAASVCCIAPLALVMLGVGGAAAGLVEFMTPLRPIFIGLALLFLGFAAHRLFWAPRVCAPGTACADPRTLRKQRLAFVGAVIVIPALVAFPWYANYLV